MQSFKKIALSIILIGLFVSIGLNIYQKHRFDSIPRESYIDTIFFRQPVPVDSLVIRYETHYLPIAKPKAPADTVFHTDTLIVHDSILVEVPITQKYYHEPEYEAWISGFNPKLDSINVYAPTNVIKPPVKDRWIEATVGLQGGVGWNGKDFQPYVGVGVQIGVPIHKFFKK